LQRLAEEVRVELAAARAAAASAAKDAEQKAAAAAADAALAVKRAATAEAELGKVRAELAKLQQDAKVGGWQGGGGCGFCKYNSLQSMYYHQGCMPGFSLRLVIGAPMYLHPCTTELNGVMVACIPPCQIKRMDAEDREEDHKQEVDRLKAEVAQAVARLQKHGEDRETVGGWVG
jgi:hypothetical protein